jgi:hypothetical protein
MNRVSSPGFAIHPGLPAASRRRAFFFVLRAVLGLTALLAAIAPFAS